MIKVKNLDLQYGSAQILSGISFELKKGSMVGLIGPNGAGKSSLIKVLAGLVFPENGEIWLNNKPIRFQDLRPITGFLIDTPAFYPFLSGLRNLKLLHEINKSREDIQELIDLVGLSSAATKKVKTYSTGMKQRLAIAASLLKTPKMLILDEPFNGLDPDGYKDLWTLLNDLNAQGVTIIISSHLLVDLEEHATDFMLIHQGKLALQLSKAQLERSERRVTFYFSKPLTDQELLLFSDYEINNSGRSVEIEMKSDEIATLIKQLVEHQIPPVNIKNETILEQTYFNLSR